MQAGRKQQAFHSSQAFHPVCQVWREHQSPLPERYSKTPLTRHGVEHES